MIANRAKMPQDALAGVFTPSSGSEPAIPAAVRGRKASNSEFGVRNSEFPHSALRIPHSAITGGVT